MPADLPTLDRFQRIEVLSRVEGFLPATKPEQVEALALESYRDVPGGAAKHISEIVRRQHKNGTEEPIVTGRRVVHDYIGYAKDAQVSGKALTDLADELDYANPELILDRVVTAEHPGMVKFLRFFDLSVLRDDKGFGALGYDPQSFPYNTENRGIMFYVGEAVGRWTVHQVRTHLPDAIESEENRAEFWTWPLQDVEKYYRGLKDLAVEGLNELGVSRAQ